MENFKKASGHINTCIEYKIQKHTPIKISRNCVKSIWKRDICIPRGKKELRVNKTKVQV